MRSCLRTEAIKLVAARGDKICYAHGQANNFLITKRLDDCGLSLTGKDTQCTLNLAARFMAENTKPTPTPAKTYLAAAEYPELDMDEKKEQKEHIAMLLSFYERTMAIAAAKAVEEMEVVDTVADAAADEAGTAVVMVQQLRSLPSQSFISNMIFLVNQNKHFMLDVRQHCHSVTH